MREGDHVAIVNPQGQPDLHDWNKGIVEAVRDGRVLVRFFNPEKGVAVWIEQDRLVTY